MGNQRFEQRRQTAGQVDVVVVDARHDVTPSACERVVAGRRRPDLHTECVVADPLVDAQPLPHRRFGPVLLHHPLELPAHRQLLTGQGRPHLPDVIGVVRLGRRDDAQEGHDRTVEDFDAATDRWPVRRPVSIRRRGDQSASMTPDQSAVDAFAQRHREATGDDRAVVGAFCIGDSPAMAADSPSS